MQETVWEYLAKLVFFWGGRGHWTEWTSKGWNGERGLSKCRAVWHRRPGPVKVSDKARERDRARDGARERERERELEQPGGPGGHAAFSVALWGVGCRDV